MDKMKKNKTIYIIITMLAFLILIAGGILTVIGVMINQTKLFYISLPLIGGAVLIYIILFIILLFFFKKKEWYNWIQFWDLR